MTYALDLVLAQARRRPDAVAVRQWDAELTYGELVGIAAEVAAGLRAAGAGRETVVGVCAERRPPLPAAVLGIWLAGATYLPLDPALPAERLAALLSDAGAGVVVADAAGARLVGPGPRVVPLPDHAAAAAPPPDRASTAAPPPDTHPDQAAYVLYTSGSTGRPRGVVVAQRAVARLVRTFADEAGADEHTVASAFASIGFDVSLVELLVPLTVGATVAITGAADRVDATRLQRFVAGHGVTWLDLPPALLPLLDPAALPAVRLVVTGGEAPGPEQVARWAAPGRRLLNCYGPTEASVQATWFDAAGVWHRPLPIGRAVPGFRLHVVDAALRPVPAGEPGELLVGGPGLARGYLGDPALTAARFVPDPFGGPPGERLYRTGDQVVRHPDGLLHFLGRLDRQVKIRGQRVEIGEVEAALRGHPAVGHAAVDAAAGPAGIELTAYVTPADVDVDELRAHCARQLTAAMVPARIVRLPRLPLTPSAKIDLARLRGSAETPAPAAAPPAASGAAASGAEVAPPHDPVRRAVAAAWGSVLGTAPTRPDDDFVACGGHSVAAMELVATLRGDLDRGLDVEDVLLGRTLAGIAARAAAAPPLHGTDLPLGNRPAPGPAQRRLWFLDRHDPGSAAYNIAMAERLRGPLDVPALAAALAAVELRQDALRWRLPDRDGVPYAVVDPPGDVPLPLVDLAALPPAEREPELRRRLAALAATRFDLARDRLWQVLLLRLGPREHVLALVAHHAVFDGWSQDLLYTDLAAGYARAVADRPAVPEPLPAAYADYVAWRAERLRRRGADDLAWWVGHLSGAPVAVELPTYRPRPALPSLRALTAATELDEADTAAVAEAARRLGVTAPALLLGALSLLLRRLTGHRDMVLGTPAADRRHAAFADVVGFFVEIMPLRLRVDDGASGAAHVRGVRDELVAAFAHPEAALERIVDALGLGGEPSRNPVAQVLFNMFSFTAPELRLAGLATEPVRVEPPGSPFDLTVYAAERRGRLTVELLSTPDLVDEAALRDLLAGYVGLLEQLVAGPDVPLRALSLPPGLPQRAEPAPAARMAPRVVPAPGRTAGPAPATPTERLVAALWCDVLGVPAVAATDSFFEVGGSSLAIAAVQSRLERELGRRVPVVELFRFPTVRALAAHLDGAAGEAALDRAARRGAARRDRGRSRPPTRSTGPRAGE